MTGKQNIVNDGTMLPLVEEFFSVQGEGFHMGEAAYFIRLGGCDVGCNWCDSRFAWDPEMYPLVSTATIIEHAVLSGTKSVVVTGGEPLIWNLDILTSGLKKKEIKTFVETSGAYPLSGEWDWICLSPKKNSPPDKIICRTADELKVIIEEKQDFEWAEKYRRQVGSKCRLFLQPEWSRFNLIVPYIVDYVRKNPEWRISIQAHKYLHIP